MLPLHAFPILDAEIHKQGNKESYVVGTMDTHAGMAISGLPLWLMLYVCQPRHTLMCWAHNTQKQSKGPKRINALGELVDLRTEDGNAGDNCCGGHRFETWYVRRPGPRFGV